MVRTRRQDGRPRRPDAEDRRGGRQPRPDVRIAALEWHRASEGLEREATLLAGGAGGDGAPIEVVARTQAVSGARTGRTHRRATLETAKPGASAARGSATPTPTADATATTPATTPASSASSCGSLCATSQAQWRVPSHGVTERTHPLTPRQGNTKGYLYWHPYEAAEAYADDCADDLCTAVGGIHLKGEAGGGAAAGGLHAAREAAGGAMEARPRTRTGWR